MLADFYIPGLSNDMKFAVEKNHIGGQILYSNNNMFWLHLPQCVTKTFLF